MAIRLTGDDLDKVRKYFPDMKGALVNNFDCLEYRREHDECTAPTTGGRPEECDIPEPTVPTFADVDSENPFQYPKCFFNLPSTYWPGCREED